ncbi:N-6 DNA methylase [Parvibaculum sp.]|uniref:N-6 DNA methylase n=1 Tax=Parvibaculum sp. TaxID=2024848 RepID=UPI001E0266A3|nr:N-6 DNA methylase [Parvibaculum sp.]MBX3490851.1 N-6 DNA methylase [Parvibaculum sp.]
MSRVNKNPHAGKTGPTREFIKLVNDMARQRRHSDIIRDFAECAYLAIAQRVPFTAPERAAQMEERFVEIVKRGGGEPYRDQLSRLLAMTVDGLEEGGDFFGAMVADLGALNEGFGQYFTPFEVSRLMAEINLPDDEMRRLVEANGFVTGCEPAAGSGGMIIAFSEVMKSRGFSPATHLWFTAVDIDPFCFHLCYVQLALLDICADVYLGDSIANRFQEVASTPAKLRFLATHGSKVSDYVRQSRIEPTAPVATAPARVPAPQLDLFGGAP